MNKEIKAFIVRDVKSDGLTPFLSEEQIEELRISFIRDIKLSLKIAEVCFAGIIDKVNNAKEESAIYISESAPFLTGEILIDIKKELETTGEIIGESEDERYLYGINNLKSGRRFLEKRRLIRKPSDIGMLEKEIEKREIFIPSTELFLGTISCVGCGRCLKNCIMLKKHHVDLKMLARMEDLSSECFLLKMKRTLVTLVMR